MAQKWYQKASVQVAVVTILGGIIIALITELSKQSSVNQDNTQLRRDIEAQKEAIRDLKRERDKFELQLTAVQAAADIAFPDKEKEERVQLLITLLQKIGDDLEKVLPYNLPDAHRASIRSEINIATQQEKKITSTPPKLQFLKFTGQSEDAAELTGLLHSAFVQAGRESDCGLNMGIFGLTEDLKPWSGVIVSVNDRQNPPYIAKAIFKILSSKGIKVYLNQGQGYGDNAVVIWANRIAYSIENEEKFQPAH